MCGENLKRCVTLKKVWLRSGNLLENDEEV